MKYGTSEIEAVQFGESTIEKVYYGTSLVFPTEVPEPEPELRGYIGFNGIAGSTGGPSDVSWNPEALTGPYLWTAEEGDVLKTIEFYGTGSPSPVEIALYEVEDGVPTTQIMEPTIVSVDTDADWYSTVVNVPLTDGVVYALAVDFWSGDVFSGGPGVFIRYDTSGGSASYCSGVDGAAGEQMPATWTEGSAPPERTSMRGEVWSS
jgi:hypothetical protein